MVQFVGMHLDALFLVVGAAGPAHVAERLQEFPLQAVAAVEGLGFFAAHGHAGFGAVGGRAGGEACLLEFVFEGAVFQGGAVEEVPSVFARRDDSFERGGGAGGYGVLWGVR